MSDKSAISWTDATWNPVLGCTRESTGCEFCYAERFSHKMAKMGHHTYDGLTNVPHNDGQIRWTGVVKTIPQRLGQPLSWREPRRIFVNSMADLFHPDVPDQFIAQVFVVMAAAPWHTFQVLTKRADRMRALLTRWKYRDDQDIIDGYEALAEPLRRRIGRDIIDRFRLPLPNVWGGVSTEDQNQIERRVTRLIECPFAVRFLSAEPLLGPIFFDGYARNIPGKGRGIHWVIAGGESAGPPYRQLVERRNLGGIDVWVPKPDAVYWMRDIRDICRREGIPFFLKQWGGPKPGGNAYLDGVAYHEFPAPHPSETFGQMALA